VGRTVTSGHDLSIAKIWVIEGLPGTIPLLSTKVDAGQPPRANSGHYFFALS
jgi:hypothetical protein